MGAHLLKPLDLYTLPLSGTQLVEASAGTGKTWTIAGLYLRLLLETDASIDRLLVVTFTKAATAELRDRLRARVAEVLAAFAAGHSDDAFCQWALARFDGVARAPAAEKLAHALRVFDEAAIFTIHGFCQRVLDDVQLPALLTEPDIVPDERDWLPGLVQEAWIRHCTHPLVASLLAADGLDCAMVQRDVEVLLLKPFLQLEAGAAAPSAEQLEWRRQALARHWREQQEAIVADISDADALSRAKDQYKAQDEMLATLAAWLEGEGGLSPLLRKLTPEAFARKRKQKGRLPEHGFWQALADWFAAADSLLRDFRRVLIDDVRAALSAHKRERGLVSYQDLLALLAQAVTDPRLAAAIRARYSAALIDEFQDTDPLQFRIFATLFGADVAATAPNRVPSAGGEAAAAFPLYLVGDPKQAIYSFRGADIFTYLRARESAAGRYTLGTNRRSVPELVQAVNAVFTQHSNPFLFSDLRFPAVDAVPAAAVLTPAAPPLQCWLLPAAGDKPLAKERARALSVQCTVAEIVRLLQGAARGEAAIGEAPLRPGDIAVLVPRHADGRAVTEALAAAGVPAVIRSIDSVYATREAADLLAVLEAVAAPGREGVVKAALLTPLWGGTVEAVQAAQENEAGWSALIGLLLAARERWQQQGFMPMWEQWQEEAGVLARVLAAPGGERRLTNLRHLATLMQQQADIDPVPERQLAWLREQLREAASTEDTQLRLESDAARVQVLTIHVSKGLEYPVVFCPFLWDGSLLHKSDSDRAEYRAGGESRLDLGSARFAQAKTRMATERLAEKLRVLYVALTRAKYRCYALWGRVKDSELAPFSWLLLGGATEGEPDADVLGSELAKKDDDAYVAALEKLAAAVPEGVAWQALDDELPVVPPVTLPASAAAPVLPPFSRRLARRWRVSSFTGLADSAHEQESPDHDNSAALAALGAVAAVPETLAADTRNDNDAGAVPADAVPDGIHAFPRGAAAGVFWHAVLEDALTLPAAAHAAREVALRRIVSARMQELAIAEDWQAEVESTLGRLLDTPLDAEGARLGHLEAARAEMEFLYPVAALAPADFLALPDVPAPYRAALAGLGFAPLSGYLKGFVDLIYRHDGRYYVLDYKTNWLGPDDSAYTPARMQQAIAGAHYYLQYWLYTLALHRHLRVSLPDYDYDRHVGGVRYLFLRGIAAPGAGVYAARPSRALVEALDALMTGRSPSRGKQGGGA